MGLCSKKIKEGVLATVWLQPNLALAGMSSVSGLLLGTVFVDRMQSTAGRVMSVSVSTG